jgi:uncharacterized protein YndB with AHSA1/START domain
MAISGVLRVTTPAECEIVMNRVFHAPRRLVWEAMTRPAQLKRWLFGPPGWWMTYCDNELRAGGAYRWVWCGPDGEEMVMRGVYREIVPLERIVRTETCCLDGAARGSQIATLALTESGSDGGPGGQTSLALTLLYSTRKARDAAIRFGVERGTAAVYDSLETWLATVASTEMTRLHLEQAG